MSCLFGKRVERKKTGRKRKENGQHKTESDNLPGFADGDAEGPGFFDKGTELIEGLVSVAYGR